MFILILLRLILARCPICFLLSSAQVVFDAGVAPPVVGGEAESDGTGHDDDEGEAPRQDVGKRECGSGRENVDVHIAYDF